MPKVSVIVPFYNVENYIEKCLDSLLKQTLKDIEVIIVNDGSLDKSNIIAEKYAKSFPEIFRYYKKQNGGLSDARNYGINYAKGEYIAFLDSDDYVDKETYEIMYNKAVEFDSDFVECNFVWEYNNKSIIDKAIKYKNKKEMLLYARVVAWNKLIKKQLLDKIQIKFPIGLRYEDIEFFYKLLPHINKFDFVDKPLIHYVQRKTSIANTHNKREGEIFKIFENVFNYYQSNNLYKEYENELEYTYIRILFCSSLKRIVKIKNKNIKKELLKQTYYNVNHKFPNWRENEILKKEKTIKSLYIKSINIFTYRIYQFILRFKRR